MIGNFYNVWQLWPAASLWIAGLSLAKILTSSCSDWLEDFQDTSSLVWKVVDWAVIGQDSSIMQRSLVHTKFSSVRNRFFKDSFLQYQNKTNQSQNIRI